MNPLFSFHPKGTSDFLLRCEDAVTLIIFLANSRANSWTFGMSGLVFAFFFFFPLKIYSHPFMSEFHFYIYLLTNESLNYAGEQHNLYLSSA